MIDDDKLIELASIQNFDGSFKMESVLGQLLDTSLDNIREIILKILLSRSNHPLNYIWLITIFCKLHSYNEHVWATAIALAYLSIVLPKLESSWMLVGKKAENWFRAQQLEDGNVCIQLAEEFVNWNNVIFFPVTSKQLYYSELVIYYPFLVVV